MIAASSPAVVATGLTFPEGPVFDSVGRLWCVELRAGRLWRRDRDGRTATFGVGGAPNGLAIDTRDRLWFCDSGLNQVRIFDPRDGSLAVAADRVDGHPLDGPNDLAFDRRGNLVFTCPSASREAPVGYLCCLRRDGSVTKVGHGLQFPNGLAFARGDDTLIVAESRRQRLWRGRWDADRAIWRDPEPFCGTHGPLGPDGLAIDDRGTMFVAIYGAGRLDIRDADGGDVGDIAVPGRNPTNCAFDVDGPLGLVVTEAERGEILSFPDIRSAVAPWLGVG